MNIKLIRMSIVNFKGIKNLEINFDGKNANIYGDNATGKTTIFDAFLWVLFNKNSAGNSDFGYKPFDLEGNEIHFLNTEVEITLQINNVSKTFKKVLTENWVKKRGNTDRVYTGNTNNYWVDEVPIAQNEFEKVVNGIINEKEFKMLTNPLFFNTLTADEQRKTICKIAGLDNMTDEKILEENEEYAELKNKLLGRTVEDYSKIVNETIKSLKDELDDIPSRVDENTRTMITVDDRDVKQANDNIVELEKQKNDINNYLNNVSIRIIENNKLVSDLAQKEREKELLINQIKKEKNADVEEQRANLETHIERFKSDLKIVNSNIQLGENTLLKKTELEQLRKEFDEESAKKFIDNNNYICPGCGREFDESKKQEMFFEAKNKFIEYQNKKLQELNLKGQELSKLINSTENDLKENKEKVKLYETTINELELKLSTLHYNEDINYKEDARYMAVEKEIEDLKSKVNAIVNEDTTEKINKLKEIDEKISAEKQVILKKETQKKAEQRIEELKNKEKELANKIQEQEAIKFLIEKFKRTKINLLETTINEYFDIVKFKLFETQKNGGLKEVCYATVGGVPYSDLNSAMKINAGLDIIRTLMKYYNAQAPVFIDNKETINNLIAIDTQLISLIVSNDKNLKIEIL